MRIASTRRSSRRALARPLALLLATGLLISATCEQATQPLTETQRAVHLLSRATYGVQPADLDEVLRIGADAWLEQQLYPERIDDSALQTRIASARESAETSLRTSAVFAIRQPPAPPRSSTTQPPTPPMRDTARMMLELQRQARVRAIFVQSLNSLPTLFSGKLQRALYSERQLEEVMTDFWFNHFNVYYSKGLVRVTVADYETEAIRRHVFGRFEDMLRATARHPAMLAYLDNAVNTSPVDGLAGRGLNENYARELLELHTLGVDGGYTQQDVVEVARAFTGWTHSVLAGKPSPATARVAINSDVVFQFDPEFHDTGEKTVLGQTLPAGRGIEDGEDVLSMLAAHPSTARFIATKLVRHFVADDPPSDLVEEIAAVFVETGGDLREVTRALFTAEAFYAPAHFRAKTKRPFEFMISALRATGAEVERDRALYNVLRALGHVPYSEAAPTGYPTEASEWMSAGAVLARINFAMDLAEGRITGVTVEPEHAFGDAVHAFQLAAADGQMTTPVATAAAAPSASDATGADPLAEMTATLLDRFLHGVPAAELRAALAEDIAARGSADPRAALMRAMGLALGSPDFQRY